MLRFQRGALGMFVIFALAIVPTFTAADAQPVGASPSETIAQTVTAVPCIARQCGAQAPSFLAAPSPVNGLRIPAPPVVKSAGPRRELTFGGATASRTSLCCLFLVYLI
jgi:hypothetical protein